MPTRADADGQAQAFLAQLRSHHYSKTLQDHAQRILPRLFAHLRAEGIADVREATEAHLIAFTRQLATTPTSRGTLLAPQSQNSYLAIVRRFFAFLERSGAILGNPAVSLPFRKLELLPRHVLSEKDAEALMSAPDASTLVGLRDRAILETLYGTAIRRTECGMLDLQDLDLSEGALLVRNGKGRQDRIVPVPGRAAAALDTYLTEVRPCCVRDPKEPALFLQRYGGRLSVTSLGLLVSAYGRAVGVRLSPHGLRHACATHLLRRGADIRHVQRLLGHRDIQTTARYTGVVLTDLRALLERAHPRERFSRKRR